MDTKTLRMVPSPNLTQHQALMIDTFRAFKIHYQPWLLVVRVLLN